MSSAKSRRLVLNPKALISTLVVFMAIVVLGVWLKSTQSSRLHKSALAQANQALKDGQADKAMRHLDHFLGANPNDIPALELKAQILTQASRGSDQLREAIKWNDRLLRLDPNGSDRQATRRRLAELYIIYSDGVRNDPLARDAPEMVAGDVRYRSAETVARDMIRVDPLDGSGHRLLGMALEGKVSVADTKGSQQVAAAYEEAVRLDPRDAIASEKLAFVYKTRLKDDAKAQAILDALLKADPKSVGVRLARARYFDRSDDRGHAAAELNEAVKLAPTDIAVRLTASEYASRAGDLKAARAHLDAIPAEAQNNLRVRMMLGMIDLTERHPEDAIAGWRAGLASTGGSDVDISWWLAYVLLQMDRVAEASPLVVQFARLIGNETDQRAIFLQATLDEKSGRPLQAISHLEKIANKAEDFLRPLMFQVLGKCHEDVGNTQEALKNYREAAAANSSAPIPRLAVVRLLEARSPDEAEAYLRRECQSASADASLHVALAEMMLNRQARLPLARRSWAELDAAIATAAKRDPNSSRLAMIQAQRRILTGDVAGATTQLEAATHSSPHEPGAWIAYASILERQGKLDAALATLKAAAAPTAVGDRASIRIAQARILTSLGRGREGRASLVRDLASLTPTDRAAVQEALGRLLTAQGDIAGARAAFEQWASLTPDSLQPRITLLELALSSDDDSHVRSAVEMLRATTGSQEIVSRIAQVIEMLRTADKTKSASERAADPRSAETAKILDEIRQIAPDSPSVTLLYAQFLEGIGKIDEAAAEYRRAWDRGVEIALPRLIGLLIRHQRIEDLAALRRDHPADARLEQFLAAAAKQLGDKRSMETLVGTAKAETILPAVRASRAEVLASAGKIAEAESLLRLRAEESKDKETPWLDLLRFQVSYKRTDSIPSTIAAIKANVKTRKPEVLEAGCLGVVGDRAGSEKAIAAALKAYPDDPEVLVAAAGVSRSAGRNAEALARLRRALQLSPGKIEIARQITTILAQDARTPDEWKAAWDSLEPESADPEARLVRAYVMIRCPDLERRKTAIEPLEELLGDLDANHPIARGARDYLIRLFVSEKKFDRALKLAANGTSREFDPAAINMYVEILLLDRDFVQARKQLDRWRDITPGDRREARLRVLMIREETPPADIAATLEKVYLDYGDSASATPFGIEAFLALFTMDQAAPVALRVADRLASKDPAQSWTGARLAVREKRREDAFRLARIAIAKGTRFEIAEAAQALIGLAATPGQNRAVVDEAARAIDEALVREPKAADLLIMAGITRHLQERYSDEAISYRAAIDIQPSNPIARNNLAWVLGEDLNKAAEALAIIDPLIRDLGPNSDRLGTRGVIFMRLGRLPEAIKDLEESIKLQPVALTSYYLALTYHKAGRTADSVRTLETARKAGLALSEIDAPQRAEYQALLASTKVGQSVQP